METKLETGTVDIVIFFWDINLGKWEWKWEWEFFFFGFGFVVLA
jgi:hypothetical protein